VSKTVNIAGPPTKAEQPRVGFPWTMPLTSAPSRAWIDRFNAVEWGSLTPDLQSPYNPRLDGSQVWLPGLRGEALQRVLDVVAAQVEEIGRQVAEEEQTAVSSAQRTDQEAAKRFAEDSELISEWWQRRAG
jgi:hypothetical protein